MSNDNPRCVLPSTVPPERDSQVDLVIEQRDLVALVIEDPQVGSAVREKLSGKFLVARADMLWCAAVAVLQAGPDLKADVGSVRSLARSDVAVIVLHDSYGRCATREAGALGCVHPPYTSDALPAMIESAIDLRDARAKVDELTKKLDVEAYLASIGRVTAGLSHELANPLAAAVINARIIEKDLASLMSLADAFRDICFAPFGQIEKRIQRGRELLHERDDEISEIPLALSDLSTSIQRMQTLLVSLRPLMRRGTPPLVEVDLQETIAKVVEWAKEDLSGVAVEVISESVTARAEPIALTQLLFNLTTNAAYAAKTLSSPRIRFHVYRIDADHVVVSVRDNGPGIPESLHAQVFEPFFTTRRASGGTGLGLALCREYAAQMDGSLTMWSQPGRGACFRVLLRRA